MRRLGLTAAWLIAAVFAIHPVMLPTVAWVSRQGDLLGSAAAALAFLAYLRARQIQPPADERGWTDPFFASESDEASPTWPWAVFAIAAVIAVLAGSAIGTIAALVLAFIERRRHTHTQPFIWASLALFAVGSVISRALFPGVVDASVDQPLGFAAAIIEPAIAFPLTLLHTFWPVDVAFMFDRSQWVPLTILIPLAILSIAIVVLPLFWRRISLFALSAAVLCCILGGFSMARAKSPTALAADLLPYPIGLILIAVFIAILFRRIRRRTTDSVNRTLRWTIGVACLLPLGTLTFLRASNYADADGLLQHSLAINPDSLSARIELSKRYSAEGFLDEASTQLDRVPDDRRTGRWLIARGQVFDAQKQYSDAARCYQTAHDLNPTDQTTIISLAEAQNNAGQPDKAASLYTGLLDRVSNDPGLLTNAGLTQVRLGHPQAAADLYEKALAVDPRYLPAHINLANVLFELGKFQEASSHLQTAVKIDPRNFPAFMNAGVLLHRLREPAKAERMFRAALAIDPKSADAFDDLGIVLAAQGKLSEAAWSFTQAIRLSPDHAAAAHLADVRRQLNATPATQPN